MNERVSEFEGGQRIRSRSWRAFGAAVSLGGLALLGTGVAVQSVVAEAAQPAAVAAEPAVTSPTAIRRLNEMQYRRAIEDTFGAGITVPGRFDPRLREGGLLAVGDAQVAISSSGFEQYELRARQIAADVLGEKRRAKYVACTPAAGAFDRACATQFVTTYGRQLYRRPLTASETATIVNLSAAAGKGSDFFKGLEIGLARMLASPHFIFRVERSVPDAQMPGGARLDDWSLASRISFLLWDAAPDTVLLDAAAGGDLRTDAGVQAQVDRMIASPRFAEGTRAFFSDMFAYDGFDGLSKEQQIYPKYTSQLAKDAREQALKTIVDLLVTNNGDYRDLFITRKTFINRNLGSLYKVPVTNAIDGWVPFEFKPEDNRAGLLTMAAFLMLDPTHEGRSSPTIRGKSVRELLMCQPVPLPPANVDFSIVQNTGDQVHKTARERLMLHQENPVCAGCHKITDPIGLSLENYDAVGQFRTTENGAKIDTSGQFEGKAYQGAHDLTTFLRDSPAVSSCVVQRAYEYGVGRAVEDRDGQWLEYASDRFAAGQYRFPQMMRFIATSRAFKAISPPSLKPPAKAPAQTAQAPARAGSAKRI